MKKICKNLVRMIANFFCCDRAWTGLAFYMLIAAFERILYKTVSGDKVDFWLLALLIFSAWIVVLNFRRFYWPSDSVEGTQKEN